MNIRFRNYIIYALFTLIIVSGVVNSFREDWILFFNGDLLFSVSLALCALFFLVLRISGTNWNFTYPDLAMALFFLYVVLNNLLVGTGNFNSNKFFLLLTLATFYFVFKHYVSQHEGWNHASPLWSIIHILIAVPIAIGILEIIGVIPLSFEAQKICGGMHNQGVFANYLASLAPLLFSYIIFYKRALRKWKFSLLLLACSSTIILYVAARSAWIALGVSCLYIFMDSAKFRTVYRNTILKLFTRMQRTGIVLFAILLLLSGGVFMYSIKKDSANGRLLIWQNSVAAILEKPLFGHGFNTFIPAYNKQQIAYFSDPDRSGNSKILADEGKFAFNDMLQITVELGLVGLLFFLAIIILILRKTEEHDSPLIVGAKAGLISILVSGFFSYPLQIMNNLFLAVLFIAIISAAKAHKKTIHPKVSICGEWLIILLVAGLIPIQLIRINACFKWKQAFITFEKHSKREGLLKYQEVYSALAYDPNFRFNYGNMLASALDYTESVEQLESCLQEIPGYDLYLQLAKNYENLLQSDQAAFYYHKAHLLIPARFIPLACLQSLYLRTGQTEKAFEVASEISTMNIKVYSPIVGKVKSDALQYLEKYKSLYKPGTKEMN